MIVPAVPHVPLPDEEPIPATPFYDNTVPGQLATGVYSADRWRERPVRRRKKIPFGFRAPKEG